MKIMFVHGIGFHEAEAEQLKWVPAWLGAIENACDRSGVALELDHPFGADRRPNRQDAGILYYEDLIRAAEAPSGLDYMAVVTSLLRSYVATKVGDLFSRDRALISDELKWKAREVAAWAHDDNLRKVLRRRVVAEIKAKNPDVVVAHSYGGLITYDACLFEDPNLLANRYFVTIGTQIGNALLRREFGGRQLSVRAKHWFNLFNPKDPVFVVSLEHIKAPNFTNLEIRHAFGHDGAGYLGHPDTAEQVWRPISLGDEWLNRTRNVRSLFSTAMRVREEKGTRQPVHRALLVGVDEYVSPDIPPLRGCVNDTYLLSETLQECNIPPESIRMLHNSRATRESLVENLAWLLADVQPGDQRIFSFSGHGHRRAAYGVEGVPDELEEVLVTHDYQFTEDTGLRDRDFQDLYADLPKDVHFLIFLDMCHAAGAVRGGPLVRSFTGPGDVEHACVRWNREERMWEQADLAGKKGLNDQFLPPSYKTADERRKIQKLYYGEKGDTRRIGRATPLRDVSHRKYDKLAAQLKKLHPDEPTGGPYLPMVFMACQEDQQASEYVHGSVHYGAFTFSVVQALRDTTRRGADSLSYGQLLTRAHEKLMKIGYIQMPELLGHEEQKKVLVPYAKPPAGAKKAPARKAAKKKPAKA